MTNRAVAAILLVLSGCGGCDTTTTSTTATKDAQIPDAKIDASISASPAQDAAASFEDFPDASSNDLDTRARHLLEAICQNDPTLAADIVLPREAFIAARDTQDPAALYDGKFKNTFAAQLAHVHRREKGIEQAVFVSFTLGQNPQRAVPKRHDWKESVWRVPHSTLTFTVDGLVRRIDIAEMIAWRGNWYVAHLH